MNNTDINERICAYLQEIIEMPEVAYMNRSSIPDSHKTLVKMLDVLLKYILESNRFCNTLEDGFVQNMDDVSSNKYVFRSLKSVHSMLRYMLEVMKRVQQGEYNQRMMINNDLSRVFNPMLDGLLELGSHDRLTGLWTVERFDEKTKEILKAGDSFYPYYIVAIQLSHYHQYRAVNGYEKADGHLVRFSGFLQNLCQDNEFCAHIYEDSFVCFLQAGSDKELMDRLKAVNTQQEKECLYLESSFTCGIYRIFSSVVPVRKMREYACFACGNKKARAKGEQYIWFDEEQNQRYRRDSAFLQSFHAALLHNEIQIYFQPQVDTKNGNIVSCEAFSRWLQPDGQTALQSEYLPVLEQFQLDSMLNLYMLRRVCQGLRKRLELNLPIVPVLVNFSANYMNDADSVEQICEILREYRIESKMITIGLSAVVFQKDDAVLPMLLEQLHDRGFHIVLHYLGVEGIPYTAFTKVSVDAVKFSVSPFSRIDEDVHMQKIVKNMLYLARDLQCTAVATDVETAPTVDFLKVNGCDRIQGSYFFQPMPAEMLGKVLNDKCKDTMAFS
jgi:EAL domain-containing protein (putative c-di-GMP-specific phosphodiesterase class I)/GGDEF domain-containing protein